MTRSKAPPALVWPAWLLAALWGVGLAIPTLWRGELIGQPYTDLYPAVWGLWLAAEQWPGIVTHTTQLAFPEGMGFYYSSPIKGWLAGVLVPLLGVPLTWNGLTLAARVATVGLSGHAARAWGLGTAGSLVVAGAFGCSAVFQGYAVEGITEGTDGWALAVWAWAVGRRKPGLAAVGLALCVLSSWYLGAVACLLAVLATLYDRRAAWSLAGLALAAPGLLAFLSAFSGGAPLAPEIRAAMGAPLQVPSPGVLPGLHPFAITAYTGFLLSGAALGARKRFVLLALIPAVLSLGWGPWYELPVLSALRFPYRWHLGTLAILALAAGHLADRWRWGHLLGPLIVVENLLLAPVEPILPGAPAEVPALYTQVDGPVLDIPGPVALPPGVVNLSRPRSQYFLYAQTLHGQPTPWAPDFNSVGAQGGDKRWGRIEESLAGFDRVAGGDGEGPVSPDLVRWFDDLGLRWVVIHHRTTGMAGAAALRDALVDQGMVLVDRDDRRWLLQMPTVGSEVPSATAAD